MAWAALPHGLAVGGHKHASHFVSGIAACRSGYPWDGKCFPDHAVGGGSGGGAIDDVLAAGCDTLVTADLKYNHFEEAKYRGLNLIDAGHFETEDPVCEVLAMLLRERFPELRVLKSTVHRNETQFFG